MAIITIDGKEYDVETLSDETKALGAYPGGQSGNPGSKHYDDLLDTWAAGNYYELLYMKSESEGLSAIHFSSTLTPKNSL